MSRRPPWSKCISGICSHPRDKIFSVDLFLLAPEWGMIGRDGPGWWGSVSSPYTDLVMICSPKSDPCAKFLRNHASYVDGLVSSGLQFELTLTLHPLPLSLAHSRSVCDTLFPVPLRPNSCSFSSSAIPKGANNFSLCFPSVCYFPFQVLRYRIPTACKKANFFLSQLP